MESTVQAKVLVPAIRVQGKWYRVHAKPYEPERQTYAIELNVKSQVLQELKLSRKKNVFDSAF